jgi:hypothetical protein
LQNPNTQSSVATIVTATIELFPMSFDPRHCMGKKKSSNKSKGDEEASFSIIESQDFVAMRPSEKIWPSPSMTEEQLRELVGDGLI